MSEKYDGRGRGRSRNYATVVYPESAPPNWQQLIREAHIEALISPLHDMDVNPEGEPKKAHHHVLIVFSSVKTEKQAKEFMEMFGGVGVEKVNSLRSYARYLCHLDNPEKAQYNTSDVVVIGPIDYYELIQNASEKYALVREMIAFCMSQNVTEYADLLLFASNHNEQWFRCLCDNGSYTVNLFLKSLRNQRLNGTAPATKGAGAFISPLNDSQK